MCYHPHQARKHHVYFYFVHVSIINSRQGSRLYDIMYNNATATIFLILLIILVLYSGFSRPLPYEILSCFIDFHHRDSTGALPSFDSHISESIPRNSKPIPSSWMGNGLSQHVFPIAQLWSYSDTHGHNHAYFYFVQVDIINSRQVSTL